MLQGFGQFWETFVFSKILAYSDFIMLHIFFNLLILLYGLFNGKLNLLKRANFLYKLIHILLDQAQIHADVVQRDVTIGT